jgi:hypothetical protein
MAQLNKEDLHHKISSLIDSIGTNNNRLLLQDQRFPQIEIDLLRKTAIELYDTINQLHIANLQSSKPIEKEAAKEMDTRVVEPIKAKPETVSELIEEAPESEPEENTIQEVEPKQEQTKPLAEESMPDTKAEKAPENAEESIVDNKKTKSANSGGKKRLHEKLKSSKITSIKKAISISKRYELQHILFQDNKGLYNKSLEELDAMRSLADARSYASDLSKQLGWDPDHKLVIEFDTYLERRFAE